MNISTNTLTILRRIIIVSIFTVPFLAFLVPSSLFFPFIAGKNFAFRILVEVMFGTWIILAYYHEEYRLKFSWIAAALAFFVAIIFIADVFGVNAYRSFWSNYERMEGFVGLIHLFGYFLVVGSVLSTEKLWAQFFHTVILTSIIMIFYALLQLGGIIAINQGSSRLDGTLGNASYLAVYMLFSIAFTVFLLARHRGAALAKWAYGIIIFFQIMILYYTGTRGVILGFAVGIICSSVMILFLAKENRLVRNLAKSVIVGLVVIVVSISTFHNTSFIKENPFLNRLASLSLSEALNNPRFMVWGMARDGFKERPILGWGQENFNMVFNKYYDPGMYTQEQWFDRAHNIFLDWLIAGGLLGLFGYLFLFGAAFFLLWKDGGILNVKEESRWVRFKNCIKDYFSGKKTEKAIEASILSGLLVAYFINNIFVFDNLFSYILFFSLLAYLHHVHTSVPVLKGKEKKDRNVFQKKFSLIYIITPISLVLIITIYFINLQPIFANQSLIEGIRSHGNTFMEENIQAFKAAVSYDTFGNGEAREQILQAALRVKDMPIDEKLRTETFNLARTEILSQIASAPNDARYEMFAGMLFFRYGMNDDAIAHFERAHDLSPKKQTINFDLILAYVNGKKFSQAYALAKETYELDKTNQEAAKFYAIAALYEGDEKFANDLLTKTFGTPLYYDETLINVYAMLGKFDTIIALLQKKLSDKGDDPQIRLRLAAAYLETGKKTEAIIEIQKIINAHPDFQKQGEYYISEIRAGRKP